MATTHVRQQIRDKVAALLTGLTTTGANVFPSRVHPLQASDLPGLRIYTTQDVREEWGSIGFPRNMHRALTLTVEACAKATADLDDTLDTICKEVETVLANNRTLDGLAKDCYIESTDIELSGEAEQPIGIATMTWRVAYLIAENAPTTAL